MSDRAEMYVWTPDEIVFGDDDYDGLEVPDDEPEDEAEETEERQKDYGGTLSAFTGAVKALIGGAVNGTDYVGRYSFAIRMRELLRTYGLTAFKDGMSQGGVSVEDLDPEDETAYMGVLLDQSQYVGSLTDDVFVRKAIAPSQVDMRAAMWGKSLQAFLDNGIGQASKNGMFRWEYGVTEHCDDCLRLNGQVHRFSAYQRKGLLPRSSKLKCKGFNCKCRLVKTNEKAKGKF